MRGFIVECVIFGMKSSNIDIQFIFPDIDPLPAPVEGEPLTQVNKEVGNPPPGQDPVEAIQGKQDKGNPKKWFCFLIYI